MILFDIISIVVLFILFALAHSLLASKKIKLALKERLGEAIAFYRLFYNAASAIFFLLFYLIAPKPDITIYDLHYPYDIITFVFQVLSLFGIIVSTKPIDLLEFIGIRQVIRYIKGSYNIEQLDEWQPLITTGIYKYVRHPIYFFTILFLGFRPTMDLFYMVTFICIVLYFYIGSIFEEERLKEKYGKDYEEYSKNTPRIFPCMIKKETKRRLYESQVNDNTGRN
ncbi:methyltransferase family protein [Melioribacter sp. OK-6-Me]|uniref:methyltransferase family protein n=1 Tax=unclassified Melioribacter TaxID=2627329 RepID=UPI003EDB4AF0